MSPAQIKKLRKSLGMSQAEFGRAIGLDDSRGNANHTVRTWETGRAIPSGPALTVMRYMAVYGLLSH